MDNGTLPLEPLLCTHQLLKKQKTKNKKNTNNKYNFILKGTLYINELTDKTGVK